MTLHKCYTIARQLPHAMRKPIGCVKLARAAFFTGAYSHLPRHRSLRLSIPRDDASVKLDNNDAHYSRQRAPRGALALDTDGDAHGEFIPNHFVAEPFSYRQPPAAAREQLDDQSMPDTAHLSDTDGLVPNADTFRHKASAARSISVDDIKMILNQNPNAAEDGPELLEPPLIDQKDLTVFLFSGQGAQFVGMGRNLLSFPNVKELYDVASDVLGFDLLKVCLTGPREELNQTHVSQPAIYVCSMAVLERIRAEHPEAIENCYACAGFSVGEYAALTFAGAFDFEDALRVIKARSEAMQRASLRTAGGLLTVKLSYKSNLETVMDFARRHCAEKLGMYNPVCQIAGCLFADCKIVGGNEEALQFIEKNAADFHVIPLKRVPVSGAFHTHLMARAQDELSAALNKINIRRPRIPVLSNFSATVYQNEHQIRRHLVSQLTRPIKWEQTMQFIFKRPEEVPMPHVYEVGPGSHLRTMVKNIGSIKNQRAVQKYHCLEV